ncbi:hypothetical protein MCO_00644 [Bartonella sp. DB5-6]|nr:hypothetical protein MCO_00644 [Bartonella sp. DB5-6]
MRGKHSYKHRQKPTHTHIIHVSPTITDKGDKSAFLLSQNSIKLSQNLTELDEKASIPFLHSIRKKIIKLYLIKRNHHDWEKSSLLMLIMNTDN